jgi:HEAT repeat protein
MTNYIIGVLTAATVLAGGYYGLEWNAGSQTQIERPLENLPIADVMEIAKNKRSKDHVEAILELGNRDDDFRNQVILLSQMISVSNYETAQAAEISMEKHARAAIEIAKEHCELKLSEEMGPDGRHTNEKEVARDRLIAAGIIHVAGESAKDLLPDIKNMLSQDDIQFQRCGLFALRKMPEQTKECEARIAEILADRRDFNNQLAACRLVISADLKSEAIEKVLLQQLKEGLPSVQGYAAMALGNFTESPSGTDITSVLLDALKTGHPVTWPRVVKGLARLGSTGKSALPALQRKLTVTNLELAVDAAMAIFRISGDRSHLDEKINKLLETPQRQRLGMDLISELGAEGAKFLDPVTKLTTDEDAVLRESAAIALGDIGPAAISAKSSLTSLLNDSDALVRNAAKVAIAKMDAK